jgi:hypothetical protein
MRRRYQAVPPRELIIFDGYKYATSSEWGEAFEEFLEARERWRREHGLPVDAMPPHVLNGDEPWDQSLI